MARFLTFMPFLSSANLSAILEPNFDLRGKQRGKFYEDDEKEYDEKPSRWSRQKIVEDPIIKIVEVRLKMISKCCFNPILPGHRRD